MEDKEKTTPVLKKTVYKKVEDFLDEDLKEIGDVKDFVRAENITVVLKIGNDRSPSYREVQLNKTAYEIKARV